MSINDYWLAKMRATEAGGEEANPQGTVATNEEENMGEDQYQEGSQGTVERLNRETGEVEEVPADPATTPAPGVVDENPPEEVGVNRTKVEPGERPTIESVRGTEHPVVDENYRPVSDPEKHDGPVFEYSPTVSDTAETTDEDEVSAEENVPAETKTDDERRADVAGTTRENEVSADLERESRDRDEEVVSARNRGDVTEQQDVALASAESQPGQTPVAGETVTGTFEGTVDEDDSYEQEKAAATEKVPTQASNKQEIKDYLTYEHGVDPDDLKDLTKSELLDMVNDLAE